MSKPYFKGQQTSDPDGCYYPDVQGVAFRPLDKKRFVRIYYCLKCKKYGCFIAKYKDYAFEVTTKMNEPEPSIEQLELTRTNVLEKWKQEKT